jgi:hypothetical protein
MSQTASQRTATRRRLILELDAHPNGTTVASKNKSWSFEKRDGMWIELGSDYELSSDPTTVEYWITLGGFRVTIPTQLIKALDDYHAA